MLFGPENSIMMHGGIKTNKIAETGLTSTNISLKMDKKPELSSMVKVGGFYFTIHPERPDKVVWARHLEDLPENPVESWFFDEEVLGLYVDNLQPAAHTAKADYRRDPRAGFWKEVKTRKKK